MNPQWLFTNGILPLTQPDTCRGLGSGLRLQRRIEANTLEQNKKDQWAAVQRMLQHAYETSEFYAERFRQAGVTPRDIRMPEDLTLLPVLTRDDIRNELERIRSRNFAIGDLSQAATGGTTDTPVPIFRDRQSVRTKLAAQWLFNNWAGFHAGQKVLYLWGARSDYAQQPSWRWTLYDRYVMHRRWLQTSLLNEEILESYRIELNRFRPHAIFAYPTPLQLLCEYLRDSQKPYFRPKTVICTAEALLDTQRSLMEQVLGGKIFEHYGSREFGMIAAECECHTGLHLNPASAYIEFVPVQGAADGLCDVVVTDLLNYGMPLVRYKVNDCAFRSPEQCECGRGFPLLGHIAGRSTDIFRLPNGDTVPGVSLTNRVIRVCPEIKKIQIVQETPDGFRVRFVPGPNFTSAELERLEANLHTFLPDLVHFQFEEVADIPREKSGKTRLCISRVRSDQTSSLAAVAGTDKMGRR